MNFSGFQEAMGIGWVRTLAQVTREIMVAEIGAPIEAVLELGAVVLQMLRAD